MEETRGVIWSFSVKSLREKCPKSFSGLYYPAFGLKKYGKIRTRKNSVFGHFSQSEWLKENN